MATCKEQSDLPAFALVAVSADWLPADVEVPAYSNGQRWNGWAVPYFTQESAFSLLKFMPELSYDSTRDAFISKSDDGDAYAEDDVFPAVTLVIDGISIKTYAIGAGSWCWHASDNEVSPQSDFPRHF